MSDFNFQRFLRQLEDGDIVIVTCGADHFKMKVTDSSPDAFSLNGSRDLRLRFNRSTGHCCGRWLEHPPRILVPDAQREEKWRNSRDGRRARQLIVDELSHWTEEEIDEALSEVSDRDVFYMANLLRKSKSQVEGGDPILCDYDELDGGIDQPTEVKDFDDVEEAVDFLIDTFKSIQLFDYLNNVSPKSAVDIATHLGLYDEVVSD